MNKEVNRYRWGLGYEDYYIIEYHIVERHSDNVYASYDELDEALGAMNYLNPDDYELGCLSNDGTVSIIGA